MAENPVTRESNRKAGEPDLLTVLFIGLCFIVGAVFIALLQQSGPIHDTVAWLSKHTRRMLAALPDIPSPDVKPPTSGEFPFDLDD
jgi:hypothetical protein